MIYRYKYQTEYSNCYQHLVRMNGQITQLIITTHQRQFIHRKSLYAKIYIPYPDNLPKAIKGIRTVSVQRMIRLFGSFSGVMTELKQIINNKHWNAAWGMLALYGLGLSIIENIFWKKSENSKHTIFPLISGRPQISAAL